MRFILLICFLLFSLSTFALPDKDRIKELKEQLESNLPFETKVKILCELSAKHYFLDSEVSLNYSKKALKLSQQHNYQKGIAMAYNCMAAVYTIRGNAEQGSTYHYKALRIRENIKDSVGISQTYNNLAILLREKKQYAAAIELHQKSLQISEALQDTLNMDVCHHNMGGVYLDQNMYKEALHHYKKAIQLKELMKDEKFLAGSLNAIGVIYTRQGYPDKAIPYHSRALKLATKVKFPYDQAYAYDGLSEAYYKKGNLNKSIALGLEAFQIVRELKALNEMYIVARALSKYYSESGDYKKAFEYQTMYIQYKDTLYNSEVDGKIKELQLTYRNEKAEQENKLLKTERDLNNQQLERKNTVQLFIAALLLITLAAAFFLFKGKQRLHTVNSLLVENSKVLNRQKEELTQQAALLQEQKQELEKLHTVKDRLFSVIAHDLRGPLASLQDLFKLLSTGVIPAEKFNSFLIQIEASQQNALWLLDNLLVWAKSQMQGFKLAGQQLDLHSLAEENIRLLSPQALQKGVELKNEISEQDVAFADAETIKLVFRNLISNAIKFCSQGHSITLTAEQENNMLKIAVKDTGTGIKPEHLARLFGNSNFTTNGTAKEKGSGLGLSLCKEFIEQNRGSIWVESEYGKGSTFYFTLPVFNAALSILQEESITVADVVNS